MFLYKFNYYILVAVVVMLVVPNTVVGQPAENEPPTLIMAGNAWDGLANQSLGQMEILVDNGTIIEIGENVSKPDNYRQVDLSNYTVTPGLMDLHVHIGIPNPSLNLEQTAQAIIGTSPYQKLLMAQSNINNVMMTGFTTLRQMGDPVPGFAIVDLRNAINNGTIPGPRLVVATHFASNEGGHGDVASFFPKEAESALKVEGQRILGEDEGRKYVRNEVGRGSDFIKIFAEGAASELGAANAAGIQGFTNDELKAMIDESVRLRVPVSVHLHTPNTTQFVVDNGASFIEHGSMIDEETMDLMAEKGVAYMPTVNRYIQAANANETWFNSLPSYAAEQYRELGPMMKITQEVLVDKINDNQSNLKVGYGSDLGYDQPLINNWKEMEALVDLGLTPVQALKAATSVAADIIDRPDLGTLEVNKTADIVAWDEDVTQDWEAIKNNVFVMKEGKIYKTPE